MPAQRQVLIISEEITPFTITEMVLESQFAFKVKRAQVWEEALEEIEADLSKEIFLVICPQQNLPKCSSKEELKTKLMPLNRPLAIFIPNEKMSEEIPSSDNLSFPLKVLTEPIDEDHIIDAVAEILSTSEVETKEILIPQDSFKKVKGIYLSQFSSTDYDLYIELASGKMVQVASKENKDMKSVINHYEEKDIFYFLLSSDDYLSFIEHTKALLGEHETQEDEDGNEVTEVSFTTLDLAFTVAQDQLQALNINKVHQEFVNRSLEGTLKDLQKSKDLFQKLKGLLSQKDYVSNHSVLNIYFASYLLSKLNWSNEQSLRQMIYACFYHDFEIRNDELAKIRSLSQIESPSDQSLVKEHPLKAAKLVEQLEGLNNDAYKTVLDHHERPDGKGFPQGLNATNTPPMSCVFIISHEIIDFLIEKEFQTQYLAGKFQEMEIFWNKGNYKRPFNCAREILLD